MNKYEQLVNYLKGLDKVILAFSGGVDSTFLLFAAKEALGDNVKAVTVKSPYIPEWEVDEAIEFTKKYNINHDLMEADIIDSIKNNPTDRCYLCKTNIFTQILNKAKNEGYKYVIDGTNFDDIGEYRPGLVALKELEVVSPLLECKIKKQEIRDMAKEKGLNIWDKPAYACLLTRLPHDNEVNLDTLKKIEKGEDYLRNIGLKGCRVRAHNEIARIELMPAEMKKILDETLMKKIAEALKNIGFTYVTLDLSGYKTGSFNKENN